MKNFFMLVSLLTVLLMATACTGSNEIPFGDATLTRVELVTEVPATSTASDSSIIKMFSTSIIVEGYQETSFEAFVGQEEWLAIYINQPSEVTETYVINLIILNYPDGTQLAWQPGLTSDSQGRKMEIRTGSGQDKNIVYIPVIIPQTPGTSTYSIEQIRYTDVEGQEFRVNKEDDISTISVSVTLPPLERADGSQISLGHYYPDGVADIFPAPLFKMTNISNLEGRTIYEIRINGEVYRTSTEGFLINPEDDLYLDEGFVTTEDWFAIEIEYDAGLGLRHTLNGYFFKNSELFVINALADFEHISRDISDLHREGWGFTMLNLEFKNNIHFPSNFEPFYSSSEIGEVQLNFIFEKENAVLSSEGFRMFNATTQNTILLNIHASNFDVYSHLDPGFSMTLSVTVNTTVLYTANNEPVDNFGAHVLVVTNN